MRIAVNTRLLIKEKLEGIGGFTYESFIRITKQHPEHQFLFLFDRNFSEEFIFSENIIPLVLWPQARHPILFHWWFERSVKKALRKHKADLFVSPDGYLSLATDVPSIAVMHDLNFEHRPQDLPPNITKYYKTNFPKFAKKASRIATVSEYSKQDIMQQYNIPAQSIDVVYDGASEIFKPLTSEQCQRTREEFSGGNPYFVFVGAMHPRKNIANLLRAFDQFKKQQTSDVLLLMVGDRLWCTDEMEQAYGNMAHHESVKFLGRLPASEIAAVVGAALCMCYVSHFEGFGIPILEAMHCDVPVITSNVTSMPEVAGDAALLTNPDSVEDIAKAMSQMAGDEKLRDQLVENGRLQREKFSWDLTAEKLWACIEKVASNA